jgi:hypothetical protein
LGAIKSIEQGTDTSPKIIERVRGILQKEEQQIIADEKEISYRKYYLIFLLLLLLSGAT